MKKICGDIYVEVSDESSGSMFELQKCLLSF